MSISAALQVIGAVVEFGGIATVAWGIHEARQEHTTDPSIWRKVWTRVQRAVARFRRRRRDVSIHGAGGIAIKTTIPQARVTVTLGEWGDDVAAEERLERLRKAVNRLEGEVDEVQRRIDDEEGARSDADEREEHQRVELGRRLGEQVTKVATGGLRRETWGVIFFGAGLGLQTWGNLLAARPPGTG